MVKLVIHGGQCCGMRHIFGFNGSPEALTEYVRDPVNKNTVIDRVTGRYLMTGPSLAAKFANLIAQCHLETNTGDKKGKTIEVVITDGQLSYRPGSWLEVLQKHNFKLVNRFRNTTGAVCNVFHLSPSHIKKPLEGWNYD